MEPVTKVFEDLGLLAYASVYAKGEDTVMMAVANPTSWPVKLYKDTCIGTAQDVSVEEYQAINQSDIELTEEDLAFDVEIVRDEIPTPTWGVKVATQSTAIELLGR